MIRFANEGDLDMIAHCEAISYPLAEGASKESIRGRLKVFPQHFWLLEDDKGQLLGFINGMVTDEPDLNDEMYDNPAMHNEKGKWQMIFSVVTDSAYRGKGYAEKIMQQVIADAKAQGRKGVVLTCKERLISFYAKFGFIDEGISTSLHGGVVWHQMRLRY